MKDNVVIIKSKAFAVRIIKLAKYLREEYKEYPLADQIMRSGTSIGANLAEAECAISRADFLSKAYIALKECSETLYWLDLLFECNYIDKAMYNSIYSDCDELKKILSSITKTTKEQTNGDGENGGK